MIAPVRSSVARILVASAALVLGFPAASPAQPCGGQGNATLAVTSPEPPAPGRRIALRVTGAPSRPFAVAADVGPGPVVRPGVGTICLDLSPRLVVLFNGFPSGSPALDAAGAFTFDLNLPPRAVLGGRTFYMQAFVGDPAAPNGVAISPRLDLGLERAFVESFATTARRDTAATTASWLGDGVASGAYSPPRSVDVTPPDSGFLLPQPLSTSGNRIQLVYSPSQVGAAPGESILGISWGPRSNFTFPATYFGTEVLLGHSRRPSGDLSRVFASNFDGPPSLVFGGDYAVPGQLDTPWFPWPEFTSDFEYDATRSLVLDVNVPAGAATFQLFRATSVAAEPRTRIFGEAGATLAAFGEATVYHTRFSIARWRSVAQSTFFDTGLDDPDYSAPAVRAAALPAGTELSVELEGAEDADRDGAPDPGTLTGFRADANEIDGRRLVRFRLRMRANPATGAVPVATSVSVPYR